MQKDKPTRFRILEAIKSDGPQPVRALSAILEISDMAVRQHLVVLERDGFVRRHSVRRPLGRPEHVYQLTESGEDCFPQHYGELACDLLDQARQVFGPEGLDRLLQARLQLQFERYAPRVRAPEVAARLLELTALQDEAGYMASCDAATGEIVQRHCCIGNAAQRCPELCEQERRLFEMLLGASVERVQHRLQGDPVCRYRVVTAEAHA